MDEITPDGKPEGMSRRAMLRRSALVGGTVVWMAPAVQTLAAPAFANGSTAEEIPCTPGLALSEVTVLTLCNGKYFWTKYNPQTNAGSPTECGPNINVAQSNGNNADPTCDAAENAILAYIAGNRLTVETTGCPSATVTNGNLCVGAGCTILAWTVHDGTLGNGHKCAYKVGNGSVVYGIGAQQVLKICTQNGTTCFSK